MSFSSWEEIRSGDHVTTASSHIKGSLSGAGSQSPCASLRVAWDRGHAENAELHAGYMEPSFIGH